MSSPFAVRLCTAQAEIARRGEYEYLVVNDNLDEAIAKLKAIRVAEHCRRRETPEEAWNHEN